MVLNLLMNILKLSYLLSVLSVFIGGNLLKSISIKQDDKVHNIQMKDAKEEKEAGEFFRFREHQFDREVNHKYAQSNGGIKINISNFTRDVIKCDTRNRIKNCIDKNCLNGLLKTSHRPEYRHWRDLWLYRTFDWLCGGY